MKDKIIIKVRVQDINYVNRIMEGYEYLGLVSTVDRIDSRLIIHVTPDTYNDALEIVKNLGVPIVIE